MVFRCTGSTLIFFGAERARFHPRVGRRKLRNRAKCRKSIFSDFYDIIFVFFRNQKPITTMCLVMPYDHYFWSYRKMNYFEFWAILLKTATKLTYFAITQIVFIIKHQHAHGCNRLLILEIMNIISLKSEKIFLRHFARFRNFRRGTLD